MAASTPLFDSRQYQADHPYGSSDGPLIGLLAFGLVLVTAVLVYAATWSSVSVLYRGLLALILGMSAFVLGSMLASMTARAVGRLPIVLTHDGMNSVLPLSRFLPIPRKPLVVRYDQIQSVTFKRNGKGPELAAFIVVSGDGTTVRSGNRPVSEMNRIREVLSRKWPGEAAYHDGPLAWPAEDVGMNISRHAHRLNPSRFTAEIPGLVLGQPRCHRRPIGTDACGAVAEWKGRAKRWYCPREGCFITDEIPIDPAEIQKPGRPAFLAD